MRILIADALADQARVALAADGHEVRLDPALKGPALITALEEFQPTLLIVRSTKVTREAFDVGCLALVVRAGAGVNTIDLEAAGRTGTYVSNCPGKNADAVAELTIGLLVAVDRHIAAADADLKSGTWNKKRYSAATGLKGRTLGLLGLGKIGQGVARRARAFDMNVVAWSRSLTPAIAATHGVEYLATPEEVAQAADILSVHLALTDATRGFVGPSLFDALGHDAIFLNTSRAEVVDEDALLDALENRSLKAGLDVFSNEPAAKAGAFEHPIAHHPNVTGSHHIGASTTQAQLAVADEAVRVALEFAATGTPPNCVNLTKDRPSTHTLIVRHLDRVGVLASVLGALREGSVNVGEMANTRFTGGAAAVARIGVDGAVPRDTLTSIAHLDDVLHVRISPEPS